MIKINVENAEITVIRQNEDDFISLTDMAHSQLQEHIIFRWLSLKSTIEYLGEWEMLYNPDLKGNIRDYATINQLICLSNMENLNAVFINDGFPQSERLEKLNKIAIQQMKVLENVDNRRLLK